MNNTDLNSPENREAIGWCVGAAAIDGNLPNEKFMEFHKNGTYDKCCNGDAEAISIVAKEVLKEENRRNGYED